MVGGGGWSLGKKLKNEELAKKNQKGERKREENNIKMGEKSLKMHLFGLVKKGKEKGRKIT